MGTSLPFGGEKRDPSPRYYIQRGQEPSGPSDGPVFHFLRFPQEQRAGSIARIGASPGAPVLIASIPLSCRRATLLPGCHTDPYSPECVEKHNSRKFAVAISRRCCVGKRTRSRFVSKLETRLRASPRS